MPRKAVIIGYLIFIVLVFGCYFYFSTRGGSTFAGKFFASVAKNFQPTIITVEKGEGVKEIAQKLKSANLIKNSFFFEMLAFLTNSRSKFWPGEYNLSSNQSLLKIIKTLTKRESPSERLITIIEGWDLEDIGLYLEREGIVKAEEFWKVAGSPPRLKENNLSQLIDFSQEYEFLKDKPKNIGLEGYLFPDTYRIYQETNIETIIRKMLDNFDRRLTPEMRTEIKRQGKTIFEIITLASIIEKESSDDLERRMIADIFYRRLENKIPLQSCATVNYILGTKKRQPSYQETRTPSLYNTYLHPGLPIGPISNPGLSAIKAVIYPLPNNYWYFLSPKEGENIFSKTKEEHDKNKAIYLK